MAKGKIDFIIWAGDKGEKFAKWIYKKSQKRYRRYPAVLLVKDENTNKWYKHNIDLVHTKEMEKEIIKKRTDLADGVETNPDIYNNTVSKRVCVRKSDAPMISSFKTKEWGDEQQMKMIANQLIPLNELTDRKIENYSGFKGDFSQAIICSEAAGVTFEKLQTLGIDPMQVLGKKLKYNSKQHFGDKKEAKAELEKNSDFLKKINKKIKSGAELIEEIGKQAKEVGKNKTIQLNLKEYDLSKKDLKWLTYNEQYKKILEYNILLNKNNSFIKIANDKNLAKVNVLWAKSLPELMKLYNIDQDKLLAENVLFSEEIIERARKFSADSIRLDPNSWLKNWEKLQKEQGLEPKKEEKAGKTMN